MKFNPEIHHRRSIRLRNYNYSGAGIYFITINTHKRKHLFGTIIHGKMELNNFGKIICEEWLKTADIRYCEIELDEWIIMPDHFHAILIITGCDCRRGDPQVAPTEGIDIPTVDLQVAPTEGIDIPTVDPQVAPTEGIDIPTVDLQVAPTEGIGIPTVNLQVAPTEGIDIPTVDLQVAPTEGIDIPTVDLQVAKSTQRYIPNGPKPRSLGAIMAGFKSASTRRINIVRNMPGMPVWQRNYYEHIIQSMEELFIIRKYIRRNLHK